MIKTCRPRTNFVKVTASRRQVQRAEPFSALYEQGKVRHVGYLNKLEDELTAFSTYGYTGPRSPEPCGCGDMGAGGAVSRRWSKLRRNPRPSQAFADCMGISDGWDKARQAQAERVFLHALSV